MMNQFTEAYVDGLVQERRNSIANTLVLRLSCTNPLMYGARSPCVKVIRNVVDDQALTWHHLLELKEIILLMEFQFSILYIYSNHWWTSFN